MAKVLANPFVLKDCVVKIAVDEFQAGLSQVEFVPSTSQQTWKGLAPAATKTDQGLATWVCNLSLAQDWDNAQSLANYLLTNEGKTVAAEFVPKTGAIGVARFTANITLAAPSIGGTVDAFAVATISCGSDKPVKGLTTAVTP